MIIVSLSSLVFFPKTPFVQKSQDNAATQTQIQCISKLIHGFHSLFFFFTTSSISITPSFHLFPPPSKSYTPLQTTTRFHHSLRKSTKQPHRFIPTNKLNSCFIPMLLNKTAHSSRFILFRRRCFHLRNIPSCARVCTSDDTLGSIFE